MNAVSSSELPALGPKERLLRALRREKVDRPPVACMGGMMNAAIVEIAGNCPATLPAAHFEAAGMAELALEVAEKTGFENLSVPFCMTVEAEALGSSVDPGSLACEPKIASEAYQSAADVPFQDLQTLIRAGRIPVVLKAVEILAESGTALPIIASLTGPVSTAASLVYPPAFFKELRKKKAESHRLLGYIGLFLAEYARLAIRAGADVIAIGDPSATGEILGPALFEEFVVPYLRDLVQAVHAEGTPTIVHICGDTGRCRDLWPLLESDAVSVDAMINLAALKPALPETAVMGNVSTYLLEFGTPEKTARRTRKLVRDGVDIIAPACGLSTSTKLAVIRAMTDTVRFPRRES
ncbi:MAG: methylcobamide--CoM methyltransferase [Deltaproteobacteria bacterium]|jgi:[methyl-Co(III) methanol-specific corrinoid protein]:coenzyme M methyltransferase|nr:methylcobamide--CoM methyltransferase [Deltaproteobacteria bacterium]